MDVLMPRSIRRSVAFAQARWSFQQRQITAIDDLLYTVKVLGQSGHYFNTTSTFLLLSQIVFGMPLIGWKAVEDLRRISRRSNMRQCYAQNAAQTQRRRHCCFGCEVITHDQTRLSHFSTAPLPNRLSSTRLFFGGGGVWFSLSNMTGNRSNK